MFKTDSYITIGDYEFPYCCEVTVENGIDSLTDTCKITLPRKFDWDFRNIALGDDPILKRKDPVLVKFAYGGNLNTEFIGFVKDIKSGTPVTIECEDYMMLLKQSPVTHTFKTGTSLRQFLTAILPKGIEFKCLDGINIGDLRITKCTPAKILEDLKSRMGLFSYFRLITENNITKPVLYVGWAYWTDHRKEEEFEFGRNIIDANNLVYKRSEDVRLRMKVISVSGDNKRKEIEVGDPDGELRTVHYYKADEATMRARAAKDLERFKYTGYHGNFLTFGEPSIQKGDVASLVGNRYHPSGKYLIWKVTKHCGVSVGIKQIIEPNKIVNDTSEDI